MSDLFINDRVKSVAFQVDGYVIGKFRSRQRQWDIHYAVEFFEGTDGFYITICKRDELIKLPDMPDPPPLKAKTY